MEVDIDSIEELIKSIGNSPGDPETKAKYLRRWQKELAAKAKAAQDDKQRIDILIRIQPEIVQRFLTDM